MKLQPAIYNLLLTIIFLTSPAYIFCPTLVDHDLAQTSEQLRLAEDRSARHTALALKINETLSTKPIDYKKIREHLAPFEGMINTRYATDADRIAFNQAKAEDNKLSRDGFILKAEEAKIKSLGLAARAKLKDIAPDSEEYHATQAELQRLHSELQRVTAQLKAARAAVTVTLQRQLQIIPNLGDHLVATKQAIQARQTKLTRFKEQEENLTAHETRLRNEVAFLEIRPHDTSPITEAETAMIKAHIAAKKAVLETLPAERAALHAKIRETIPDLRDTPPTPRAPLQLASRMIPKPTLVAVSSGGGASSHAEPAAAPVDSALAIAKARRASVAPRPATATNTEREARYRELQNQIAMKEDQIRQGKDDFIPEGHPEHARYAVYMRQQQADLDRLSTEHTTFAAENPVLVAKLSLQKPSPAPAPTAMLPSVAAPMDERTHLQAMHDHVSDRYDPSDPKWHEKATITTTKIDAFNAANPDRPIVSRLATSYSKPKAVEERKRDHVAPAGHLPAIVRPGTAARARAGSTSHRMPKV